MTLLQTQPHPADAATRAQAVTNAMDASEPRVGDDMTVEVALSVMAGARAGHLLVCDDDGRCTGLITRTRLTAVRDSSAYTDRVQLRDVLGAHGAFTAPAPAATKAEAGQARRYRRLAASPVVYEYGCTDEHGGTDECGGTDQHGGTDEYGGTPGVLALALTP
ncbi:CBS domain-containing protein [Streptomyces sp. NPDC048637]|uniref:CBS domain-containing protein n=1 Tax=Streptomyces sp. NPDC048637 TaxID=3155636 RepID=UPI0034461EE2